MALRLKEIDMNCGIKVKNPYFKLRFVAYDGVNGRITYNGAFYVSESARQEGKVEEMPGMYIDDAFESTAKDQNLFELAYNHIKEIAKDLKEKGVTLEDIAENNNAVYAAKGTDGQLFNKLYYYFIDSEDC